MSIESIENSLSLLENQRRSYQSGILVEHFMSLEHGLRFLRLFSKCESILDRNVRDGIKNLVPRVEQKLNEHKHLREDESLVMKLDHEYADLREQMKNLIIKPGINKYHDIFEGLLLITLNPYWETNVLLCEIIEELLSSDCKADQISHVRKELEDFWKMLSLLEPWCKYDIFVRDVYSEETVENSLSIVASVMERVTCFIYLATVGKMDDEMILSLKNSYSDLIIEETQIMKLYLSLDVSITQNLKSHISMSLKLLEWNKRCYLGTELGEALEDHFTSIKHGLQYLVIILTISDNNDLKLRVQRLIVTMKQKLYSLPYNQNYENLKVHLEHAYGELKEEMKNVVIEPGTDTFFPKTLNGDDHLFLEKTELTSLKFTSNSKAEHIAFMMKKLKALNKLTSFRNSFARPVEIKVNVALASFLDRATCLMYLSFITKLNEDMVFSLRKTFSSLIAGMETKITHSLKLLKIHRKSYQSGVNGGILLQHCMSLEHGLQFLGSFFESSDDEDLIDGIASLVHHVNQKLYSLRDLTKDESLVMKLEHEYADLREQMKNLLIKSGINKCNVIFPERVYNSYAYKKTNLLLCEIIEELVSSDCKADQISQVRRKELEDIRKILSLLRPFFKYAKYTTPFDYEEPWNKPFSDHEKEKKSLSIVASVMERVTRFIYLASVGKMNDEMVFSLKNSSSDHIIEETQIMKMYISLDVDSIENLKSHIFMSLRLLGWNKRSFLGTELGEALEDHFMSIENGLQYLLKILKVSKNEDLKLRVQRIIDIVKQKLYTLPHDENNENLKVNLEHAYGELREEMKNVVIQPGTGDYDTLFSKVLNGDDHLFLEQITESASSKLTSGSKADQVSPMMKEIKELRKKLTSLKPLFEYARINFQSLATCNPEEIKVNVALTSFLDRATCLIYVSFTANLNEDMVISLRKGFSLLIEETDEIHQMTPVLGIVFEDDVESDIDISLSLLKRHQEYHMYTINEVIVKDHIISLKHGIEFLKWIFNIYNFDEDLKRCIMLLAANVRQQLEFLTYKLERMLHIVDLNMDVNAAYAALREEMKNVIINQIAHRYGCLFSELIPENCFYDSLQYGFLFPELIPEHCSYVSRLEKIMKVRRNYDFLLEKITTLVTSIWFPLKEDQITLLKKELQDLWKRISFFKPLGLYICGIPWQNDKRQILKTLLTFHHKATFLIYLTFVGPMDNEMSLLVNRNISIAINETDAVQEIYTEILNEYLSEGYPLQNLMIMLESNGESLNNENIKLHEVIMDIQSFLFALPPYVILRKLHLLKESFEDILRHSIPIIYSCYLELPEVNISVDFNCVLDLIKHIKSEAEEMKIYYFPRVDDLGYLKFFLGYLKDLMKNQEILMQEEIDDLHFEVNTLISLAKSTNQEAFNKNIWNDTMNLAYQAEYIIDLYLVSSPRNLGFISSLSKVIRELQNIRADVNDSGTLDLSCLSKSLPTEDVLGTNTQLTDHDAIVGLQEETKNIMAYLLTGESKLNVVTIIGMAGVGKTTLAFTSYNSPSTANYFDIRAWCTVSQSYQIRVLLLSILDQVNPSDKSDRSNLDDEELAERLCRSLKKRRYLMAFDDVWDTALWNYLQRYLPDDKIGSRILITTRNRDVADQMVSKVNELNGLSDESSWDLFQKKMLEKERLSDDLLDIAKGIVKKCKGLPLSIVIIAGILSGIERSDEKWNQIAKSVSSFVLSDTQANCRAILELSYNNLPNYLRSCFLYLGSFPEDQEISVNQLILLWIGEGFVEDTEIDTAEEVAKRYVEDLTVKSLVIPASERSRGGVKTFRLHDLLRDFCLDKAKEKHFFMLLGDEAFDKQNHPLALQDPRRIIINGSVVPQRKMVDISCDAVRSMICYNQLDAFEMKEIIESCDMVLLKVLEVNKLRQVDVNHFPDISSLVHLRYLAFRSERLLTFQPSISKLLNLQILIIIFEEMFVYNEPIKVPDFIWDMVKLRHFRISEASFDVDSNRLQNASCLLKNLKSLSKIQVSCSDSKWLSKLSGLERLGCVFKGDEVMGFRKLSFNETLISLKVGHEYRGDNSWFIGLCQLPKSLRKLSLSNFYLESKDISTIGQTLTHLEVFKIDDCSVRSGSKWVVDDEDFPELKVLKLRYLNISKWIVSEDSFPRLEQLLVEYCNSLNKIPLEFGSLPYLRLITVNYCLRSINDSAREIEKLQHENQNTEMRAQINDYGFDDVDDDDVDDDDLNMSE